jgi:glycine/D-amino acid oxidase-like deaminating enzyme
LLAWVTGKSTAKVTSQHRLIYRTLKAKFGEPRARLYAETQEAGVRKIKSLVTQYAIDSELEPKAAYVYTCDESYLGRIEEEVEIAQAFGLPASFTRKTRLPFDVRGAIRFDDQAQFHPTKYVAGLAETIPGEGCHVFEQSRVVDWDPRHVVTNDGSIAAKAVVMAARSGRRLLRRSASSCRADGGRADRARAGRHVYQRRATEPFHPHAQTKRRGVRDRG